VVPGHGDKDATIAYVGEAPGGEEDKEGKPFVGRAGNLLDSLTFGAGIDPDRVFEANVLCCRPPRNAIRECPDAVSRCPDLWLKPTLNALPNLRVVVALGATAGALWFPGQKAGLIAKLAGVERIGDRDTIVVGSYHPAYALREGQWVCDSIVASLSRALVYSGLER
jgi:DNA polymerase